MKYPGYTFTKGETFSHFLLRRNTQDPLLSDLISKALVNDFQTYVTDITVQYEKPQMIWQKLYARNTGIFSSMRDKDLYVLILLSQNQYTQLHLN